ncbi:hypothetical protein HPP92_015479 [Vanilla planifolia]|uniref:Uncharacterized protein n=1 Tax=Vanilla planifolia TaxID=51239 RepID=A0A835QTN5_VANPL|nr:hypothetical protein HPP92_015479 [Vanilla planifolia]
MGLLGELLAVVVIGDEVEWEIEVIWGMQGTVLDLWVEGYYGKWKYGSTAMPPVFNPSAMLGQGFDPTGYGAAMGRMGAGYGAFPAVPAAGAFSGMLPSFPPVVAPHVNPAFFGGECLLVVWACGLIQVWRLGWGGTV